MRTLPCLLMSALLVLPGICSAAWSLPVADAPESPALRTAMAGLLDDYKNRLPTLYSLDGRYDEGGKFHPWSDAVSRFAKACAAETASCDRILSKQLDLLETALDQRQSGAPVSLQDAVTVSAMVDLCGFNWRRDTGTRCMSERVRSMAGAAASTWYILGYPHLFLAFQKTEEERTAELERWVRKDDTLNEARKAKKIEQLGADVSQTMRRAFAAELTGRLTDAAGLWGINYVRLALPDTDRSMQLTALANMTSLAARQGQIERARRWRAAAQGLGTARAELAKEAPCVLLQQDFDIALAQGEGDTGAPFPATQRVNQLIDKGCAFGTRATQAALAALAQARTGEAAQVLAAAQQACARPPVCGHARNLQIAQLLTVARLEPAGWRKAAAFWKERLATPQHLLATEIDIVWALAERLRAAGATGEALPLFQQLERHVGQLRKARNSPPDMARYDELTRARVALEVSTGAPIAVDDTESLRGQRLLRQLTLARWTRRLADVQDADALAELNGKLAQAATLRKNLSEVPADQYPLIRATLEYMLEDVKELEVGYREAYLVRLIEKKIGIERRDYGIASPLSSYENWANLWANYADPPALADDDAYLSWLRVPGGYIGTLMARPSGRKGLADAKNPHVMTQRFIAFSDTDEAVLELYRQMLQSGASMVRGARVSAPMGADPGGLMLGKLALWQLPDGSLQGAASAPPGARRVTQFSTLSDALYARLLAPFAPLYQEAQRLIVSPDGALVYLPFETLSRKGVSVLESVDIGYVQSLAVYGELKRRVAGRRPEGQPTLLSVADPVYATMPAASAEPSPLAALSWPPLPGTRVESRAVASLFQQPRQLLGTAASRKVIDAMAAQKELKRFQVLHFATHGYVDDARSALVLTPEGSPMSAYLSDQDIVQWELESDLVLLSACNTGIGRRQQGEGVVGLPYAFFMAGNLNTLMSLWPVDDQGTAALIPAFMARIQAGEDHVTALNNTKRAFARGEYGQALRNPRIWSAFVLYGVPLTAPPPK